MELAAACGLETEARRTDSHEGTGREVVREREEGGSSGPVDVRRLNAWRARVTEPAIWRRNRVAQWSSVRVSTAIAL